MEADDAEGGGEVVAFAEDAGGGRNVGKVVKVDGCSGEEFLGFG